MDTPISLPRKIVRSAAKYAWLTSMYSFIAGYRAYTAVSGLLGVVATPIVRTSTLFLHFPVPTLLSCLINDLNHIQVTIELLSDPFYAGNLVCCCEQLQTLSFDRSTTKGLR